MKVTWEVDDIRVGRKFLNGVFTYQIGWYTSRKFNKNYYGIFNVNDGMFTKIGDKQDVADYLNKIGGALPVEYIIKAT